MKITFLGTGTSQGVPVIACPCEVCTSMDVKDKRLRTSVMIEDKGTTIVIDTGPDFRQQMLRAEVKKVDAVVFTHEHKDHIAGFDDIRAYNYILRRKMDVYASMRVQEAIHREFAYIFNNKHYPGIPEIVLYTIVDKEFTIGEITLTPIHVLHYRLPVLGFRIGDFTYITDANFIAEEEKKKILGSKVLVLNALRKETHISHFTFDQAVEMANELNAPQTYLTHLSHQMGLHNEVEKELPPSIKVAYDGLVIEM